jgi:hypothetical protein
MLSKCAQLRSLYIGDAYYSSMSDDDLAASVIPSKHMNELCIDSAHDISDAAMMAFLAQLRDTGAQLDLRKCYKLTGATLRHVALLFPTIKKVVMRDTCVIVDSLIDIITQCPAIVDVDLGGIRYKRTAEVCALDLR